MSGLGGGEEGRAVAGFSLFVVLLLSLLVPASGHGRMVASVHDFVDDGFTGGGVCAECHVPHLAGEVRLWPRDVSDVPTPTAPAKLCRNCHNLQTPAGGPTPTLNPLATIFASEPAWAAVAKRPKAVPASHGAVFDNCTRCHRH